jgi:hypothetical protein
MKAYIVFEYDGVRYSIITSFSHFKDFSNLKWCFTEGNLSCDCNRSLMLRERWKDFPELECNSGENKIKLVSLIAETEFE